MPTSCSDCPLCYDMMECSASDIRFFKVKEEVFDFCTERHPNCPLIPVPPHGRLIDAEALPFNEPIRSMMVFGGEIVIAKTAIDEAPTIITADKGGDAQ